MKTWQQKKQTGTKISVITCYDFPTAQIIAQTDIDALLVGDTLSMVVHGCPNTTHATIEMMRLHTQAVARGAPNKLIIGDLPFLTYRKDLTTCMNAAESLMQAGAQALKLEGVVGNETFIQHLVRSGIPMMGHIGLTPQSVHTFGGYKVQGRAQAEHDNILNEAKKLQDLGCFALVAECVPHALGAALSAHVEIPVIGIGAGNQTDGQVLVLHDMLGYEMGKIPKFVRKYANAQQTFQAAFQHYHRDVVQGDFPSMDESYQ